MTQNLKIDLKPEVFFHKESSLGLTDHFELFSVKICRSLI